MLHARRGFLALALNGLSLLWLGEIGAVLGWRPERRRGSALEQALVRLFRDPRSARRIGAEYLRSHHPGREAVALLPQIEMSGLLDEGLSPDALAARSRRDFAEGRVVQVSGWILSETEAHVCALTLLLPARGTERSRA